MSEENEPPYDARVHCGVPDGLAQLTRCGRVDCLKCFPAPPPTKTLREVCYAHILATLDQCGGNKSHAARALDIDRRALYRWLDKIRLNERWEGGEA